MPVVEKLAVYCTTACCKEADSDDVCFDICPAPVDTDPGSQLVLAHLVNSHGTRNLLLKLSSALQDAPTAVSSTGATSPFAQPFGCGPLCKSFSLLI